MNKFTKTKSGRALRVTPLIGILLAAFATSASAADSVFQYRKAAEGIHAETAATFSITGNPSTTFSNLVVGESADITLAIQNTGTLTGSLTLPALTGANPGDFSASTDCTQVAAQGTCSVRIRFSPTAIGARAASLQIGKATVNLSGTGDAAPSDPYYANVTALFHFDGNVSDSTGKTTSGNGGVAFDTGKFGSGAALFNGSSSYVSGNSLYSLANPTWTIEMWIKPAAFGGALLAQYAASDNQWNLGAGNASSLWVGGTSFTFGTAMALNTWHHIAFVRNNGTTTAYVDGVRSSVSTTATMPTINGGYLIGSAWWGPRPSAVFNGAIDDLRITAGVARYTTATISVPPRAFPNK